MHAQKRKLFRVTASCFVKFLGSFSYSSQKTLFVYKRALYSNGALRVVKRLEKSSYCICSHNLLLIPLMILVLITRGFMGQYHRGRPPKKK